MGQKSSIMYAINHKAMKVWANAHCQNFLPGQDITLTIAQISFENSCESNIRSFKKALEKVNNNKFSLSFSSAPFNNPHHQTHKC